jgi:hypothetical protein
VGSFERKPASDSVVPSLATTGEPSPPRLDRGCELVKDGEFSYVAKATREKAVAFTVQEGNWGNKYANCILPLGFPPISQTY